LLVYKPLVTDDASQATGPQGILSQGGNKVGGMR
jgi:hypothetical protein